MTGLLSAKEYSKSYPLDTSQPCLYEVKKKTNIKSVKSHSQKYNRNPKHFAVEHSLLNGHFPIYHSQTFSSDQLNFIAGKSYSSRSSEHRNRMYVFTSMSFEYLISNNTYCTGFYKTQTTTLRTLHALINSSTIGCGTRKITLSQSEGGKKQNLKGRLCLYPRMIPLLCISLNDI